MAKSANNSNLCLAELAEGEDLSDEQMALLLESAANRMRAAVPIKELVQDVMQLQRPSEEGPDLLPTYGLGYDCLSPGLLTVL